MFVVSTEIQGNFTWKSYAKHKVQCLLIALLTMGVGAMFSTGAKAAQLTPMTAMITTIVKETLNHGIGALVASVVNYRARQLSK